MSSVLSPGIREAFELVSEPLNEVKDSLLAIIPPDSVILAKTVQASLQGGGKYLRPVITLLSGLSTRPASQKSESEECSRQTVEVAAVAEMIHVATLLHDDVIDHSDLRRGKKTIRSEWGNKVSVLSGDYLLAQASMKLSRLNNTRLVSIFSHVLGDLCDGEVEQMHASFELNTSWDSYYKKTIGKTASLFSAGCEASGVINALPESQIQRLRTYGRNFGIAFQIVDDLLDYTATEAEMGKPVLDDLRNGLMTAPILLALISEKLSETERLELKSDVQALFLEPSETLVSRILLTIAQSGAIDATRELAEKYVKEARQALDFVEDSAAKEAMLRLVDYILERRS